MEMEFCKKDKMKKKHNKNFIFVRMETTDLPPTHPMASKSKGEDYNPFFYVKKEGDKIIYQTKNKTKF